MRRWRILEELLVHDVDVLCLQEVDHDDILHDFYLPLLGNCEYAVVPGQRRTKGDCVAVAFKPDRFKLMHKDTSLEFATVACFEDLRSGAGIVVCSAHLKAGKTQKFEQIRLKQARQLKTLIQSCTEIKLWCSPPEVLLCADMNAEAKVKPPEQEGEPLAYRHLRNRVGAPDGGVPLDSAYSLLPDGVEMDQGFEPEYTTLKLRPTGKVKRTIDYMLHSRSLKAVALLKIPTKKEMPPELIPSYHYPSDHISLGADFHLAER